MVYMIYMIDLIYMIHMIYLVRPRRETFLGMQNLLHTNSKWYVPKNASAVPRGFN